MAHIIASEALKIDERLAYLPNLGSFREPGAAPSTRTYPCALTVNNIGTGHALDCEVLIEFDYKQVGRLLRYLEGDIKLDIAPNYITATIADQKFQFRFVDGNFAFQISSIPAGSSADVPIYPDILRSLAILLWWYAYHNGEIRTDNEVHDIGHLVWQFPVCEVTTTYHDILGHKFVERHNLDFRPLIRPIQNDHLFGRLKGVDVQARIDLFASKDRRPSWYDVREKKPGEHIIVKKMRLK